ncbi:MAG: peptidylprolyl isomerase [Chloroflexia bacterium]
MKRFFVSMALLALGAMTLAGCGEPATSTAPPPTATAVPVATGGDPATGGNVNTAGQPEHITVQHILIGFKDAVGFRGNAPPAAQARTQEQAKALAYEILEKAKKGEDFDQLVVQYTDDSPPGIYSMANIGVQPDSAAQEAGRQDMVAAFGDVGFTLQVGEIGIADYDDVNFTSPYGWHIIKRVK